MSSAVTVLRPACFASFTACTAVSSANSSIASASTNAASSLILAAPAFLIILLRKCSAPILQKSSRQSHTLCRMSVITVNTAVCAGAAAAGKTENTALATADFLIKTMKSWRSSL